MPLGPAPKSSPLQESASSPSPLRSRLLFTSGIALLAAFVLLTSSAQPGQQSPSVSPSAPLQANHSPDANIPAPTSDSHARASKPDPASAARKKQLTDESAQLLTLAMSLKAEVDKTNKDTLSLHVIRKADEIEKLARTVKEKMKLEVGGS